MRKYISIFLSFIILCSLCLLCHINALAAEESGQCGDDVYWAFSSDGTMTLSGSGPMWDYSYENPEFSYLIEDIKSLVVEEGISTIGSYAFMNAANIQSISLPESMEEIKGAAFYKNSSLTEIDIPAKVSYIGDHAFAYCANLQRVEFLGSAPKVGIAPFKDVNTQGVYPKGDSSWSYEARQSIGSDFRWSSKDNGAEHSHFYYAEITVAPSCTEQGYTKHSCSCGDVYIDNYTQPAGHSFGEWYTAKEPSSTEKGLQQRDCTLCDEFETRALEPEEGTGIPSQGNLDFAGNVKWTFSSDGTLTITGNDKILINTIFRTSQQIRKVIIEEGIEELPYGLFEGCTNLESVSLPSSLRKIDECVFKDCSSLKELVLPEGLEIIDAMAFQGCTALEKLSVPSTIKDIGYSVFENCSSLTDIQLSENLSILGESMFRNCGLKEITIPASIKVIPDKAFFDCASLENVSLQNGLESIDESAFSGCSSLTSISFPDSVQEIGYSAFSGCTSLTEVNGGKNVTTLHSDSFYDCPCVKETSENVLIVNTWVVGNNTKLEKVTIPENINLIANYAFAWNYTISEMVFQGSKPIIFESSLPHADRAIYPADNESWKDMEGKSFGYIDVCIPSDHSHDYNDELIPSGIYTQGYTIKTCRICSYVSVEDFTEALLPYEKVEWQVLQKTNRQRYLVGVDPLTGTALMQKFADIRGDESVDRQMNNHTRPDGSSYRTIPAEIGLTGYTTLRENLFWGGGYRDGPDAAAAVNAWMGSDSHREAILMPTLSVVGVSYKVSTISNSNICAVQNFAGGGRYTSFSIVAEPNLSVELGTAIEDIPVYAQLENTVFGTCWLPIISEYCSGYDPNTLGKQTISVSVMGYSASFEVTVTDPANSEHRYYPLYFAPGCTAMGYVLYTCEDCGHVYKDKFELPVGHKFSAWVSDTSDTQTRSCTVCGMVESRVAPIENPFTDVKEGDFFYDSVLWAVNKGVTSGLSATQFGPSAGCTRAQVVTFLWRAAGKPAPTTTDNPFKDVAEGQYYYDAVLWAVENGITTGLSADSFGPNVNCNRGQIVTFLWRAMGKPIPTSQNNPFADVSDSQYYYDAVLWAVEKGVTTGVGKNAFAPNQTCTRGQIVTFLYRVYEA